MMRVRVLKYLLVYIIPAVVVFSIWSRNMWSYTAVVFIFGILPFFELFTRGSTRNLAKVEEEIAKQDILYDVLLWLLVPVQYAIMAYFLYCISGEGLSFPVKLGLMLAYGMSCGIIGINAAHELGHRHTGYEQLMSQMLLLTSLYMHFFIEHNRGHHKNVSTDEDPASARKGENVYAFYLRTVAGSWLSAWHLERIRLEKKGLPVFSLHNQMLRFQLIQLALLAAIYLIFGWATLLWFIGGATIGFMLLETVNYIEHYGLRRERKGDIYERVTPVHSWNSNHPLGRLILLELSRHSDHHYLASRKYQILRHFDESPQMPTGYPGMMLMALLPPLWFKVMDPRVESVGK